MNRQIRIIEGYVDGKRKKQIIEANHTEPLMPFQSNLQPV